MITQLPTKNGETTPLKNNASVRGTASHQEKKRVSSEDKLNRRKRKRGKKESSPHASGIKPASQHRDKKLDDSSNVTKVARKLGAENLAAHCARLQETKSLASAQVSVVSHSEKSGACLESTYFVSEKKNDGSQSTGFCGKSSSEFWGLF